MKSSRVVTRAGLGLAWVAFLLLFSGCGGRPTLPNGVILSPDHLAATPDPYRIDVGDELEIQFFYQPDMSRKEVVRTDGQITLAGVGELTAVGKTPVELAADITRSYSDLFKDPLVTVGVARMANARVYVVGEVIRPGGVDLEGHLSLATAMSEVGGPTRRAKLGDITVFRRSGPGAPTSFQVDARSVRQGSWAGPEVLLAPNDIVVVPRDAIGHIGDLLNALLQPGLYTLIYIALRH